MTYPEYYGSYNGGGFSGGMEGAMGLLGAFVGVYLLIWLLAMALSVVTYVLHSIGMYTIAKRREIRHPWLAWLPLGAAWILGSISDQYQYAAKGKKCSRRKVLLGLEIAVCGTVIATYVCIAVMAIAGIVGKSEAAVILPVLLVILFALAMVVMAIVLTVFTYIAYYDLYNSCQPDNAVLYLVLSIFFNITTSFFVFACRKDDQGMPPRQPQAFEPVWQPVQPEVSFPPVSAPAEPFDETEE